MNRVVIAVVSLGIVIVAAVCFFFVGPSDDAASVAADYAAAEELLVQEKPGEALEIILQYSTRSEGDEGPWHNHDWTELEIQAAEQMQSIPRLIYLFKEEPESFDNHENTVLMLARIFLQFGQTEDYDLLREHWRGVEQNDQAWFLLDTDYLMFQQEHDAAIEALRERTFEGEKDIPRLIRLALLSSRRNLQEAWGYLTEAYKIDPRSPEVRAFRAQILESVNQLALARVEFMASFAADPENPRTRDELAEFYRRNKQYRLALNTWKEGLDEFSSDYIWSKAYFWNSVVLPLEYDWAGGEIPDGNVTPLTKYMMNLPNDVWWDDEQFRVLPEVRFYLTTRQETFWFRLLHELQQGNEAEALAILEQNSFSSQSWDPDLETALRQIVSYRLTGSLPAPVAVSNGVPRAQSQAGDESFQPKEQRHAFLKRLRDVGSSGEAVPEDLDALLTSDEVYSATLLASGWIKAAIRFNRLTFIPDSLPRWVVYGLTQAKKVIEGGEASLTFAGKQKSDEILRLLQAETMIEMGREEEGVAALKELSESRTQPGIRAAWLLSTFYAGKGDFTSAKVAVISQPELSRSVLGQELLARIAFLEGDVATATAIYSELKERSFIAKSFLAKQAFDRKDFDEAKQLTWEMIQQYPDVLELRANLKAIIEAEQTAQGAQGEG